VLWGALLRGEEQHVTAQDGFLQLRDRARHPQARRASRPPSSGRNVVAAHAGLASMLCVQITYGCLPYFQTTPPRAKTSPTSAPTGTSTGMCTSQASSQPTRP
jgi:hypothetical protein